MYMKGYFVGVLCCSVLVVCLFVLVKRDLGGTLVILSFLFVFVLCVEGNPKIIFTQPIVLQNNCESVFFFSKLSLRRRFREVLVVFKPVEQ